jgi:hypothetical protein
MKHKRPSRPQKAIMLINRYTLHQIRTSILLVCCRMHIQSGREITVPLPDLTSASVRAGSVMCATYHAKGVHAQVGRAGNFSVILYEALLADTDVKPDIWVTQTQQETSSFSNLCALPSSIILHLQNTWVWEECQTSIEEKNVKRTTPISSSPIPHNLIQGGVCGDRVGWDTALQEGRARVRFPMGSFWDFSLTSSFRSHYDPNRNKYQGSSYEFKGGRCVGLTILPPSCADFLRILRAANSWRPWAYLGLYRDSYSYYMKNAW